jgi:KDO2-lipid IV(A) lauroyltransferase
LHRVQETIKNEAAGPAAHYTGAMRQLAAALLYVLAWSTARLPWRWQRALGDALAALWRRLDARESRVSRRNLELAYPQLDAAARARLHRAVLRTTARQALETLVLWTRPHARNLAMLRETHGTDLFDAAIAAGRGVIVAAPHYGNWELLNQWLASRTPLAILYKPPESAIGEAFLRRVRADDANAARVEQVPAEGSAVRRLLRVLQGGGVVGILPDQQPKGGDGAFAPFFGVEALTMTLLPRLAARTGATVLYAYCERIEAPGTAPAFALRIEAAPDGIASNDAAEGARALNAGVERIARRDPAQYQWTYKRYSRRPPGSGETSPYGRPG